MNGVTASWILDTGANFSTVSADFARRLGVKLSIGTHRTVLAGIGCNAVAFMAFLALLSVAQLSFAVPATALSYIVKTALAQIYLREAVTRNRWIGAILVAIGIVLISF